MVAPSRGMRLTKGIQSVGAIAACVAGVLPGMGFFAAFRPPYLEGALPLIGGVATAVLAHAYFGRKSGGPLVEAKRYLVASLTLAALYLPIRQVTTVGLPEGRDGTERWQVGFGTATCSLTSEGLQLRERGYRTSEDLMMAFGYGEDTPQLIWMPWSIAVAGGVLSILFIAILVMRAHGIGVLSNALTARGRGGPGS